MNKCIDCKLKRVCKYKDTIEEITKETNSVITFDCSYRTTVEDKDKKQKSSCSSCSGKCGECQDSCKTTSKKATSKKVETKNNINKTNKDNQTKDKEIDLVEFLNGLNALFR